jgi:uncharacterized protein (TIGR03643 family)
LKTAPQRIRPDRFSCYGLVMPKTPQGDASNDTLSDAETSAIIEMALSDHVSFTHIREQFGLAEKDVKALMRQRLKPGSYRAWRKRVRAFSNRRESYK